MILYGIFGTEYKVLGTYVHTYIHTYIPTYARTYVPTVHIVHTVHVVHIVIIVHTVRSVHTVPYRTIAYRTVPYYVEVGPPKKGNSQKSFLGCILHIATCKYAIDNRNRQ